MLLSKRNSALLQIPISYLLIQKRKVVFLEWCRAKKETSSNLVTGNNNSRAQAPVASVSTGLYIKLSQGQLPFYQSS